MLEISQEPSAIAKIAKLSRAEAPPLDYNVVSIYQAVQASFCFNVAPRQIRRRTEDDDSISDGCSW